MIPKGNTKSSKKCEIHKRQKYFKAFSCTFVFSVKFVSKYFLFHRCVCGIFVGSAAEIAA